MTETARGRRLGSHLIADGFVVACVLGWWLTSLRLPKFVLPDPFSVGATTVRLFVDPGFLVHTGASALRVAAAVVLSVVLGLALALLAERVPVLSHAVHRRLLPVLNSFPSVGWAILATVWFQPTSAAVIFVQVMILTPFCLINAAQGLRELDREVVEMARSFTRSRARVVLHVILPLLMPYLMAAVRIAYGIGWKIALVAELFGADSGLGYLMLKAQVMSDAAMVFATCFVIVIIFIAGEKLVIDPITRRIRAH